MPLHDAEPRGRSRTRSRFPGPASALLLTWLSGCSGELGCEIVWTPNPDARVPLALTGRLSTERPAWARVVLDDGEERRALERWPGLAGERELLVLGLHPATTYSITVEVGDEAGRTGRTAPWRWTTP